MSNFTLLETILIIYILVVNFLGIITLIMAQYVNQKVGETTIIILFGVAIPITLPFILYELTVDKLKRKRKQDLEKEFDDFFKEKDKKI